MPAVAAGPVARVMSVSTDPGARAFTRMPSGAREAANALVYETIAALAAA